MQDVSRMIERLEAGDPQAAERLLPLVYDELRRLAAARLAHEPPGSTLQATALVHEAYLRLLPSGAAEEAADGAAPSGEDASDDESCAKETDDEPPRHRPVWNGRGHFFAAAAEAMRRILVEAARRRQRLKHGGGRERVDVDLAQVEIEAPDEIREDLIALDAALDRLAAVEPDAARLVELRYFAGLPIPEIARTLGISPRGADRLWAYARAWLHRELRAGQ